MHKSQTLPSRQLNPQLVITSNLTVDEKYYAEIGLSIKQIEEQKIADRNAGFSGAELARYRIGESLETVYGLIGLNRDRWPTKELGQKIAKFIQRNYSYLAPEEIVDAFEFAIDGKFPSKLEHHGTMDLIYISELLKAYVKFRYDKKESLNNKIEMSKQPTIDDVKEMMIKSDEALKNSIMEAFSFIKRGEENPFEIVMGDWFDWLVEIGFMEYDATWLNEKYNFIKKANLKWSKWQCTNFAKNLAVKKALESKVKDEKPFELFNSVSYVDHTTYKQYIDQIIRNVGKKLNAKTKLG